MLVPSSLNRFLPIHSFDVIGELLHLVEPLHPNLQTVGVACSPQTLEACSRALGARGADRICAVGSMPEPAAGWHHDGVSNLTALIRWVDIETTAGSRAGG